MMDQLPLLLWSATLPLMPYTLWRRKMDLFYGLFVMFLCLSINVLMMINTPNPEHQIFVLVAVK